MSRGVLDRVIVAAMVVVSAAGAISGAVAGSGREEGKRPQLPAPRKVNVAAGRGRALVYALDQKQNRIADPDARAVGRFLEVERPFHWAIVTGVVDHSRFRASLGVQEGIYRGVELERQTLRKDATWSDWEHVDRKATLTVLDNLPAIETERVSQSFLDGALVDPLPCLTDSDWKGADVEEFLPPERRNREDRRPARSTAAPSHRGSPPKLMLRALDFTVEPGRTYRYRARIVLSHRIPVAPNAGDIRTTGGLWSEPTDAATIPSR